ncbi:sulfotransferase [Rhodobacteraceae bacterium M385]|nr:sulfotransferase [Rhodobacteraceae bacterium M385]
MTTTLPPRASDKMPLFIVGSMRSGTTWLRDMLRRVPNFICPEETHFLRWSDPFRSPGGMGPHVSNTLLRKHREMDGVSEEVFEQLLEHCATKANLQRRYIGAFAQAKGVAEPFRWFDKTPQNIYGLPLILAEFPRARVVHLVRNPLNVVASLKLGRQVSVPDINGAINCWSEAVLTWDAMVRTAPRRMMEIRYEDMLADVPGTLSALMDFAKIDCPKDLWRPSDAHREKNQWKTVLTPEEAALVARRCAKAAGRRGYDLQAQVEAEVSAV